MDVLFFLNIRTKFIRAFYEEASSPFVERKRKIEAREDPFEPPYSEDGDPPFLDEWMEADESIDVLGQMCISMLSSSLQLYLKESITELLGRYANESLTKAGIGLPEDNKAAFKKDGWINGYRAYFQEQLAIDWTKAESNLSLLEEVVLARNRAQHPEHIAALHIKQSYRDAAKYPRSFFSDELEMRLLGGDQDQDERIHPWRLNVTKEKLLAAVDEVDRFCSWLDDVLRKWPSGQPRPVLS
jgi:hypothetical protein